MADLVFDSSKVLAHETVDNNILTEVLGGVVQKKLWSDEFGTVRDALKWVNGQYLGIYAEWGWVTETNNEVQVTGNNAAVREKSNNTLLTFNDGVFETEFQMLHTTGWMLPGLVIFKDATHYIESSCFYNGAINCLYFRYQNGGALTTVAIQYIGVTTLKIKLERATNTFEAFYDVGAGWVSMGTTTQAIGADCYVHVGMLYQKINRADFHYFRPTGTGVYWNTTPTVTYTAQDTGVPGVTIKCGTASGTLDATTLLDIKFGTGGWQNGKTLAQIQALGDQVTDDGTVNIRTNHGNSTSQSGFTSLTLPRAGVSIKKGIHLSSIINVGGKIEMYPKCSGDIFAKEKAA